MYVTVKPVDEDDENVLYDDNEENEENEKPSKFNLTESLLPLQHKLTGDGQNELLQELIQGGRELDQLYEASKKSTYKLKESYDIIKKKERIVTVLHDQYYNSLVAKKCHEEDRDNFFQKEKDLEQLRSSFIENSQKFAYDNSKYVEYNQRFSKERENQISNIIKQVDIAHKQNGNLKSECISISKDLMSTRGSVSDQRRRIEVLEKEKSQLSHESEKLNTNFDELKSENEALIRVKARLSDENTKLRNNLSSLMQKTRQVAEKNKENETRYKEMAEQRDELEMRCEQTRLMAGSLKEKLHELQEQLKSEQHDWKADREQLQGEVKQVKEKLKRSQTQCYNTMLRNQTLHEKLKKAVHNVEAVRCGKLKAIVHEEKVKKRNVQLAEEKFTLINEVLELKGDFCEDQRRIKSAHRVNRKLRGENDLLRNKIVMLKENRNAVALLEDAGELREVTQEKFTRRKMLPPASAPSCSSYGRL